MWSRTHLECSVSPLSGSMTSLRIRSRKSANLSGLQRWTSSPITWKQSCGLRASGRERAIMLMPIRIRIPSFTHVRKQNFTFYFYTQQCQFTLFYLSHHRESCHNFEYIRQYSIWKFSSVNSTTGETRVRINNWRISFRPKKADFLPAYFRGFFCRKINRFCMSNSTLTF